LRRWRRIRMWQKHLRLCHRQTGMG
jgi:hypothetical protein